MIVVTGAAGFIGSQIVKGLNKMGVRDIIAVDDLTDGRKFNNLVVSEFADYIDYEDFLIKIKQDAFGDSIKAIFHQGACSATTEWDGRYMMRNNYDYSKTLLHYCLDHNAQFIYASSAAVYGAKTEFREDDLEQHPLNVYGYSKWKFDQYVMPYLNNPSSQIVGLRYFNVYGPHEQYKGAMASVAFHFTNQLKAENELCLFQGIDGYADGEQLRDFVYVEDAVNVNLWFYKNQAKSGIFNVGTGKARSFNDLAKNLIAQHGSGKLRYIPFPDHLRGAYQSFTQANIACLRAVGCDVKFHSLEEGLAKYYQFMSQSEAVLA